MIDFIQECLELDPIKRKTSRQLLEHKLFDDIRNKNYEKIPKEKVVCPVDYLKDNKEFSILALKKFIFKVVDKV